MRLLLALVLFTQTAADPLLSRLAGQWNGTGTVLNQPAKIDMAWTWELGNRFLKLTFRNEMGTAPKVSVFEGHAYYRAVGDPSTSLGASPSTSLRASPSTSLRTSPSTSLGASGKYRGMWFDNSGMFRPLEATRDGDALVSKWGTPDTEEGETTYRLRADGSMEVIDRVKGKDGTWRTFGQSGLIKK